MMGLYNVIALLTMNSMSFWYDTKMDNKYKYHIEKWIESIILQLYISLGVSSWYRKLLSIWYI